MKMKDLEKNKYWIWLSLVSDLGNRKKQKLLEKYKTPEKIYYLTKKELLEVNGIGEKTIENILDKSKKKEVEKHMEYMLKNEINIISIVDKQYPQILKEIYDPPISLYCRGNVEILNRKAIAIIGCREATQYGKKASKYFAYNLAKHGINIISGLAKGVDSYAHIGVNQITSVENYTHNKVNRYNVVDKYNHKVKYTHVEKVESVDNNKNCGKTIAVLGNGLDSIYPRENKLLADQIIKNGGAIISEYPLGTKPNKINFPARNRIISGISKGVLVIEAKEKSGTLITVDFALEQGRDVFVVPGNINSLNSVGTNFLIKQGAELVTHYTDIKTKILQNNESLDR